MGSFRDLFASLSFAAMLNASCIPVSRHFYRGEFSALENKVIAQGSSIDMHFSLHKQVSELPENDLETLKGLIETDYSIYFNRHIEFPMPNFTIAGHRLYITRINSTDIVSTTVYKNMLDEGLKLGILFLAERYGPDYERITSLNQDFLNEALVASRSVSAAAEFDSNHHVSQRYSAEFQDFSGYALPLIIYHNITLSNDIVALHRLISVWEHEYAHTLIFNEMDLEYSLRLFSSAVGISSNNELISIHETACDIISDRIQPYFLGHLNARLRAEFINHISESSLLDATIGEIVQDYESLPRSIRAQRREEIFENYNNLIRERTGRSNFGLNEAKLALLKRYSGDRALRGKLESILDNLGPNGFIIIIPKLYNRSDLDFAYRNSSDVNDVLELARMLNSKHASEVRPINF